MSSTESLSSVTDGLRLDWPVGMQARAVWLRRLYWQPGARHTANAGRHGGLRLVTLQWLDTLARRPGLHAYVVRRSMGIWSSCAMDWRALTQQQVNRGISHTSGAHAGALAPASQTFVHWHISERTIVQPGVMRFVATSARYSAGLASPMATSAATPPSTTYVANAIQHDAPMLSASGATDWRALTQHQVNRGINHTSGARAGALAPASQTVVHRHISEPTIVQPGGMRYVATSARHSAGLASTVPMATSAATPPSMAYVANAIKHEASMPSVSASGSVASSEPVTSPQSSLDFFALAQRKSATRALQARPSLDRPTTSWPGQDRSQQHVATSDTAVLAWPKPSSEVETPRTDGAAPALGDLLYDQAMRALSDVSYSKARNATTPIPPPTVLPPLHFDLSRARQGESMTTMPVAPGTSGYTADRRDSPEPTPQAAAEAANTTDAPLRRDDIEHVAQRVMRIIAREQRRDREARGIN